MRTRAELSEVCCTVISVRGIVVGLAACECMGLFQREGEGYKMAETLVHVSRHTKCCDCYICCG